MAQQHGRVSAEVFVKNLLRDRNQILDRYDGRQASDDPLPERAELASLDKTLTVLNGVLAGPYFDYLGRTVGYKSDRRYIMLNLAGQPQVESKQRPMGSPEDLGYALTMNTDLKALVVHGYHDLSTPVLHEPLPARAERVRQERAPAPVLRHLSRRPHVLPERRQPRRALQGRVGVLQVNHPASGRGQRLPCVGKLRNLDGTP